MKNFNLIPVLVIVMIVQSCSAKLYPTNGETIYKTGKNIKGEKMLDRKASGIKIVNSCRTCHGPHGDRMKSVSVQYSYLTDPNNFPVPYNDSLLFRFFDKDLKSDGHKANIGVIWKMSDQDKKDLIDYLKTL